jgi:hypothetical protein
MADRGVLIGSLSSGDIFHARAPNGASMICLVLSVAGNVIRARCVTTQEEIEFDRQIGKAFVGERGVVCVIDSIARLPPEIHDVFLKMDKKNKELMAMDEESRFADLERLKLSESEQKALIFIHSHYQSNPLPPLE